MVIKHDFEVKYFIQPGQVLSVDNRPIEAVAEAFGLSDHAKRLCMLFVDSQQQNLNEAHWNVRLRRFEGEEDTEVTYKKRYSVENSPLDSVFAVAQNDGFGPSEHDYDAQVEWGSDKQTLTLSRRAFIDEPKYSGLDMPSDADSRAATIHGLPGKLAAIEPLGWAEHCLSSGHVYGTVQGARWTGKWFNNDLSIEVWQLELAPSPEDRLVVEVSFKYEDREEAGARRASLRTYLDAKQWLRPADVLKTKLILDCY
jgi:hypothetical protein